jgi:hypothetical protein
VTLGHASTLQEIKGVLSLRQEEAVIGVRDGDAEKVVKIAEVRHGELGVESLGDTLEEVRRGSSEDDIIDVEEQARNTITHFVNKERGVGC